MTGHHDPIGLVVPLLTLVGSGTFLILKARERRGTYIYFRGQMSTGRAARARAIAVRRKVEARQQAFITQMGERPAHVVVKALPASHVSSTSLGLASLTVRGAHP